MAMDMFLQIDGIKGESRDSKYKESIDVLAWSWGVSNSGSSHTGGGGGSGKANVQDLSFSKYVDKASSALLLHACNGKHVKEATLIIRKAGEKPLDYITVKLEDLLVTSVSMGGSGGEDRLTENVTLNFAKVNYSYKEQDLTGGQKGGDFKVGWDVAANIKI